MSGEQEHAVLADFRKKYHKMLREMSINEVGIWAQVYSGDPKDIVRIAEEELKKVSEWYGRMHTDPESAKEEIIEDVKSKWGMN